MGLDNQRPLAVPMAQPQRKKWSRNMALPAVFENAADELAISTKNEEDALWTWASVHEDDVAPL